MISLLNNGLRFKLITYLPIFLFSIFLSIITLLIERFFGIYWDFHPDSVTYATDSLSMFENINNNPLAIFNLGHYYWMGLLNESIFLGIAFNILFFAVTNSIIHANLHNLISKNSLFIYFIYFIFLYNPYRLHLSTTLLKDTLIIFFLSLVLSCFSRLTPLFFLFMWRLASIFYIASLLNKKIFKIVFLLVFFWVFSQYSSLVEYADSINEVDMQFRDFDSVPSFKEFGIWSTIVRMIVWPIFAVTGLFVVISPSALYFPVALGSFASLCVAFLSLKNKRTIIWLQLYFTLSLFAFFSTGFTTYLRYIFPVISLLPLFFVYHSRMNNRHE